MKQQSWLSAVFKFAAPCKGKMTIAVIFEILSVTCGFIPYLAVYNLIILFFEDRVSADNVILPLIVCFAGYFGKIFFHAIATTFSHVSAYGILENIRLCMIRKIEKAPLGQVLSKTAGDLKSSIIDRVETIELPLAHLIPEGISNIFVPLAVLIYMLYIDWRMALASLLTIPIAFFIYSFMLTSFNQKYADYMKSSNHVNSVIVEYVEGIEVIKAFGRSGSSYEKFSNAVNSFKDYTLAWFRSTWKGMTLAGAILPATLTAAVPAGLLLYYYNLVELPQIVMCMILSMGIVLPLSSFTTFVNYIKSIQFALNDVADILNMEELEDKSENAVISDYNIKIDNISFSYTAEKEVVSNLSLDIPQGSYTALVGPSGSGKSTVARLLARYWDINEGSIKIGDVDSRNIPLTQLAGIISFVTQDNYLFNCSLRENIRVGKPNASDEEVMAAAKAALCDEFICKLEKGYDTEAGEAGNRLSGGEKQRIAIARAILKDSPVIILDEATAFTDPENEHKIQKSIMALTGKHQNQSKKTLIVIAHRLSTIKDADKIIVLNQGEISAEGKHSELLVDSQLYKELWESHTGSRGWSATAKLEVINNV